MRYLLIFDHLKILLAWNVHEENVILKWICQNTNSIQNYWVVHVLPKITWIQPIN